MAASIPARRHRAAHHISWTNHLRAGGWQRDHQQRRITIALATGEPAWRQPQRVARNLAALSRLDGMAPCGTLPRAAAGAAGGLRAPGQRPHTYTPTRTN